MPRPPLGLALVALATATFAQDAPRPSKVVETVRVDVVNVDVVVLDKDGNPVGDLTRDDFEIREDGRRVELSNFARFDGAPSAAPAAPGEAPLPVPLDPESDPHRLRLVVVFDNFFTSVPGRLRALNRLEPFLDEVLAGNAEVMIVSAGRRMGVALPFTSNPDDVRQVARRVAQATTETAAREGQSTELARQFEDALAEGRETDGLELQAEAFGLEEFGEVRALLEMLGNVVDALAGLEGRKAIVFVSDGFPVRPGDSPLFRNTVQSRYDVYGDLADLTRRANGNRVVFHALRPSGLQAPVVGVESSALPGSRGGRDAAYDRARIDRTANERSGLVDLATATGGRVLFEGNRIEAFLDEVASDLRTYYSLGYRRDVAADRTRYRKIDVRVNRKGVRVLTRKGDFSKSSDQAVEDRIRSAVLLGRASDPIGLTIITDKAVPLPDGRFRVPVLVPVPLDRIALLPRGNELAGGFRLRVGTLSSKGQMDPIRDFGYDVVVPASRMTEGDAPTYPAMFTLELPAGRVHLAIGLADDHGADLAIATTAFTLKRPEGPPGRR